MQNVRLHMKRAVTKSNLADVLKVYTISDLVDGWFFRATETSNNAWLIEGVDLWGRKVRRDGGDRTKILALCAEDARKIKSEANAT